MDTDTPRPHTPKTRAEMPDGNPPRPSNTQEKRNPGPQDLRHTWPVFFARHGSLTRTQQEAIPPILAGRNTLVIAATASGKTEAVLAPLLERYILKRTPWKRTEPALRLLYICPTRALVRDLYERLRPFLAALHISVMMKSGDTGPVPRTRPPTVLITTPESTDSLLTRAPRLLSTLDAVVLDEIHLFDDSPRGDHIRCLLPRLEHLCRYRQHQEGRAPHPWQRLALSATVPDPQGVAARYLQGPDANEYTIVAVPGGRALQAELKQSPTGAIRLSDLRRVAPVEIADDSLRHILSHLQHNDFLRPGRLGEWRPGPALGALFDAHEIYSNIGADPLAITVVDAYSGRPLAQTDRLRVQGDTLLLGGKTMEVIWRDRYRIGVRPLAAVGMKQRPRATVNLPPPTFNPQLSTFNLQPPTSHLQPSTLNLQPSTSHLPPSTFNPQPSTFNLQPLTFNLQPLTFNL